MVSAQRANLDKASVIPTVHIIHQSIKHRLEVMQQRRVGCREDPFTKNQNDERTLFFGEGIHRQRKHEEPTEGGRHKRLRREAIVLRRRWDGACELRR